MPSNNLESDSFQSCNYRIYVFVGSDAAELILIISQILLALFLMVQMCRLCSKVFSYHKFHIHEAYRFYTVAFFSSVLIILARITQLNLNDVEQENSKSTLNQSQATISAIHDPKTVLYGWLIINELMGIISISTTNIMYVVIGFTWLNIAWGCDFNTESSRVVETTYESIDEQPLARTTEYGPDSRVERERESLKQKIRIGKVISFYILYPFFMCFSVFATLERSRPMCQATTVMVLISSELAVLLLGYSIVLFLKKKIRSDQIPLYSKVILIYLVVSITARCVWFNVVALKGEQSEMGEVFQVIYNLVVSVLPIVALAILSEKLLSKEKMSLFKTQSRILNMQSTLI